MIARAALLLMAGGFCIAAQPETYRISGVVIDSVTGRPSPRIRVAIAPVIARDVETAMVTGADGRFLFEGLTADKYQLTADHHDGIRQAYGQPDYASGFASSAVTGPGLKSEGLTFRLIPPSALHGKLTDQTGEPIEGVLVQLFRSIVVRGRRSVFYTSSQRTNDLGEYRFGPLFAGTYYLLATGRPWFAGRFNGDESATSLARITYVPTFYPSTADARSAAPIGLRAGDDLRADLSLTAMPASKLSLVVADGKPSEGGLAGGSRRLPRQVGASSRVDVTLEGPAGSVAWERVETIFGDAELNGIPPGKYVIRVVTSDPGKPLYGRESITVAAGETRLEIPLKPPPVVTGTVRVEGQETKIPRGTLIELENEVENRHIRRPVGDDGRFTFENLPPGQYTPILMSPAAAIRMRKVAVNGTDAKDLFIDISRSVQLELTGIVKAGEVSGFVYRDGKPEVGALVVLGPQQESSNPYDYLAFQTDSDGSFEFTGIAPGDYRIAAMNSVAEFEYANPAVVRPVLAGGQVVHVAKDSVQKVRLEIGN